MIRIPRSIAAILAGAALLAPLAITQQADLSKPLTLAACLREALARNLDLSVDAVTPALDDAAVSETKEKYLPQFDMAYRRQDTTSLGSWGLQGTNYQSKNDYLSAALTQKIVTGADLSLSFSNQMNDTAQAYTVINPFYYSLLQFELNTLCLRASGRRSTGSKQRGPKILGTREWPSSRTPSSKLSMTSRKPIGICSMRRRT